MMDRGEIVISEFGHDEKNGSLFNLISPALVVHERMSHGALGFTLTPWIPSELTMDGNVRLVATMMRGTMTPTTELLNFYKVWAEMEREKLRMFAKEFNAQVTAIQKFQMEKFQTVRERKKREVFTTGRTLPDTIIALFEDDAEWGDPSVTH